MIAWMASEEPRDQIISALRRVSYKHISKWLDREKKQRKYPLLRAHVVEITASMKGVFGCPCRRPLASMCLNSLFESSLKVASPAVWSANFKLCAGCASALNPLYNAGPSLRYHLLHIFLAI